MCSLENPIFLLNHTTAVHGGSLCTGGRGLELHLWNSGQRIHPEDLFAVPVRFVTGQRGGSLQGELAQRKLSCPNNSQAVS